MRARVLWAEQAKLDLYDVCEYLAADNLGAALKLSSQVEKAVEALSRAPNRGRRVRELADTSAAILFREIIVRQLRVLYAPTKQVVWIHGVFDSRRDLELILQARVLRAR